MSDSIGNAAYSEPVRKTDTPNRTVLVFAGLVVIWALARALFFHGFQGYDDLHYYAYAAKWGELPTNHWQARLLFTGLIRASILLFGHSEFSATLPALLSSFVLLCLAFGLGYRFAGLKGAGISGLLFAMLPQDIFSSTSVDVTVLTAALAGVGIFLLVEKSSPIKRIGAGVFFGLSVFSHAYALFILAAASFAWFIHTAPRWRWLESILIFVSGCLTFLCVTALFFLPLTGDPLYPFKVSAESHLKTFSHIVYDLAWAIWPVHAFVFTKEFGILLPLAALVLAWKWKTAPAAIRFLGLFSGVFYAYVNWGSQSPTEYLPLWHLPRYWYPIALPACVLIGCGVAWLPRKFGMTLVGVVVAGQLLLSSLSGTWGEHVEVSKVLLKHAKQNPQQTFAADWITLNEMFVLNGCRPPENVFTVRGLNQPELFLIDSSKQIDAEMRPLLLLLNRSQEGRNGIEPFMKLADSARTKELGPTRYRPLSALLPASLGHQPFMVRHLPPLLAVKEATIKEAAEAAQP